jgi:hypothetical protein
VIALLFVLAIALGTLYVCWLAAAVVLARPGIAPHVVRPPLPRADQPPVGLAPLVPSPRVVAEEAQRGLRDLQAWLADQRG